MKKVHAVTAALALLSLSIGAQADVFNLGTAPDGTVLTNLETVTVGDPGNAADTRYATPGYGSVGYIYNIGKYEVTAAQYCDFLNAKAKSDPYGLYNMSMADRVNTDKGCNIQRSGTDGNYTYTVASDWTNRPVNYVSYWDSCRFANWINNGQGDSDTETGAYTLLGYDGEDGRTIGRNAGAKWYLPSMDEWYKAAYYKGGGTSAGYWDYPTRSNTAPGNQIINPTQATKPTTGSTTTIQSAARTTARMSVSSRTLRVPMAHSIRVETCMSGTRLHYITIRITRIAAYAAAASPTATSTTSVHLTATMAIRKAGLTAPGSVLLRFPMVGFRQSLSHLRLSHCLAAWHHFSLSDGARRSVDLAKAVSLVMLSGRRSICFEPSHSL
ncbi:MAG: formylglycine-generating enzyme family protein [Armatimonadetes bacterium]|nr:formylglycine-generating enzyme family protein [Armatimonadota bacterium]